MAQFRVMTWNVENLFDVRDDDGPKTQAQFAAKIESLRAVIDAQQPPTRRHPPNHRQRGGCLRARSRARDRVRYTSSRDTTVRVLSDAR